MEKAWDFSLEVKRKMQGGRINQKAPLCFSYWLDKVPNLFFSPEPTQIWDLTVEKLSPAIYLSRTLNQIFAC